ncbi:MAG: cob(I)yrinic acid a,c-diamide adenosyltransferase [Desulfococcus sp. 4484_241]|nr:MAG: cob(I)yrinic acid a,c-diamide adenosyltransferase [Desulfococcus sp. 4484_241]
MKGYVQVYTGDGKGKTTAALGLALRAFGAGLRVYMGQFMKFGDYSEIAALKPFEPRITVRQFGTGHFILGKPSAGDIAAAEEGLLALETALQSGEYDVVIADEANVAAGCGLFTADRIVRLIDLKPESVELVITGRNVPQEVINKADLVTEMKPVKHYFDKGVPARPGIEK